jgi:hypothetical protein
VERCLACEAVVSKETPSANAISAGCALSYTYRDGDRGRGMLCYQDRVAIKDSQSTRYRA